MSETRKETAEMRAWTCLDCGMEGEATDIPTAQEHHTSIHGCRGLCGWMPSSPQRAAARRDDLTYSGTDWRTVLDRNVTVSLEFAAHDLASEPPNVGRALALVREAFRECRRVMREANHV